MPYNEMIEYGKAADKLESLLADYDLVCTFKKKDYPISLVVAPNSGVSEQMELYSQDSGAQSSSDARLNIIFYDADVIIRTDNRLVLSDDLMQKIKSYAKKMHYLYLQAFFREEMDKRKDNNSETEPEPDYEDDYESEDEAEDDYDTESEN